MRYSREVRNHILRMIRRDPGPMLKRQPNGGYAEVPIDPPVTFEPGIYNMADSRLMEVIQEAIAAPSTTWAAPADGSTILEDVRAAMKKVSEEPVNMHGFTPLDPHVFHPDEIEYAREHPGTWATCAQCFATVPIS